VPSASTEETSEGSQRERPCIILSTEIVGSAVGGTRKLKKSALKMTLNELLGAVDGFDERNNGTSVIGAAILLESRRPCCDQAFI
jgi:ATP-dependent Zn protease